MNGTVSTFGLKFDIYPPETPILKAIPGKLSWDGMIGIYLTKLPICLKNLQCPPNPANSYIQK